MRSRCSRTKSTSNQKRIIRTWPVSLLHDHPLIAGFGNCCLGNLPLGESCRRVDLSNQDRALLLRKQLTSRMFTGFYATHVFQVLYRIKAFQVLYRIKARWVRSVRRFCHRRLRSSDEKPAYIRCYLHSLQIPIAFYVSLPMSPEMNIFGTGTLYLNRFTGCSILGGRAWLYRRVGPGLALRTNPVGHSTRRVFGRCDCENSG